MTSVQRIARPGCVEEAKQEEEEATKKPYQPLSILGGIREKGFSGDSGKHERVPLPQPSVRPFPVARHRSEGPVRLWMMICLIGLVV